MKKKLFLKIVTILTVILNVCNQKAMATRTWRVNNNGFSADTTSLQGAMDVLAGPGDTIHVEASGIPYPAITFRKKLVLIGPGYFLSENTGKQKNSTPATIVSVTFDPGSNGSVISGLRFDGALNGFVSINENNITIERCWMQTIGIQNLSPTTLSDITIKQSYCNNYITTAALHPGPLNNLLVTNCYFNGVASFGLQTYANTIQGNVEHCVFNANVNAYNAPLIFRNNIFKVGTLNQNTVNSTANFEFNLFVANSVPAWLSGGTNKFQVNSVFITPTPTSSTDYNLMQNSPANCPVCYQGYPNGTETIGMYGGAEPYILSGIPAVPTIYRLDSPGMILQGDTINVNISTRSNN